VTIITQTISLEKEWHQNRKFRRTYFESLLAFPCKANLLVSYQMVSHHWWVFNISGCVKSESLAELEFEVPTAAV